MQDDAALAALWDEDEQVQDVAEEAIDWLLDHVHLDDEAWKTKRALDVGCGTGHLTAAIAPHVGEVVAVDLSAAMLAKVAQKAPANVTLQRGDITASPPPWSGTFDLIVASCVCATLPDYPAMVARLVDALRPGGVFAQWDWLRERRDDEEDGLSLGEVEEAFAAAGLSRIEVDHAFDSLFDDEPILIGAGLKMVIRG